MTELIMTHEEVVKTIDALFARMDSILKQCDNLTKEEIASLNLQEGIDSLGECVKTLEAE